MGFPCAAIPDFDGTGTVVAFGDRSFKIAITHGVVFDADGEPLNGSVHRRCFRNRPTEKSTSMLEAEVVVEAGGVVALDDVKVSFFGRVGVGLRGVGEISLLFILVQNGFFRHYHPIMAIRAYQGD